MQSTLLRTQRATRKPGYLWPLGIAAGALLLAGCATTKWQGDESFRSAVEQTWASYEEAVIEEDTETWLALWHAEGVQLPPGAPPVVGKERISAAIETSYSQFDWQEFDIEVDETVVSGDVGYARGTYTASKVPRAGGERISIDGKYMAIFRQDDNGEWTIYRDISNSNR